MVWNERDESDLVIGRLRRLAILLPAGFLVGVLMVEAFVIDRLLPPVAAVAVSFALASVGIVIFSRGVFGVIERFQDRLRSQNEDLTLRTTQLRALNAAALQITSDLSIDAVLQSVVDSSRAVVGARYGALSVVDDEGKIVQFVTSGLTSEERRAIGNPPEGHGLLGYVKRTGLSYRSDSIAGDPHSAGFPPNHPPMTTFLGLPLIYKFRVVGDLYLTDKLSGVFTQQDEDAIAAFAVQAAIAIENARLYEKVQDIAVFEERERIAMDLHDGTIQSLYGLGLKLEECQERVEGEPQYVVSAIDRLIGDVNAIIRDIRNYIFDLRPLRLRGTDLVGALAELMRETRVNTLINTSVVVEEEAPCRSLTEEQVSQLYHIAHEAVSNAQKHARATSITAEVYEQDGAFRMRVSDNGQGFDPANNNRQTGRGMMNMAERVRAIGGHLWVESAPGQGTTLTVELPLNGEGMQ